MNPTDDRVPDDLDDPRVLQAVQGYLADLEAGRHPDRRALLARHPEIADAVAECLDAVEFVRQAAPKLDRGVEPEPVPETDLGTPLGDFRLLREIGRGGMGVVYEAEQLSLGRRIALKVLPFALTLDPRQLRRFKNEAQAAAHLHHSHIVPIHSVGCERGVHFYAMQYIEGKSLAAVVQELKELRRPEAATAVGGATREEGTDSKADRPGSPLDPRFVARLGREAAEALEHAHEMGVVHRDVKPANLLVDSRGHLWVTDFGLAQFQNDTALTVTGDLLGTLRYMSPEQARARRGLVDHRTDVWSLGVTLYELLTLEPAFSGRDRPELLEQIADHDPVPPRRLNKSVPADLETIVLKAMSKSVEDRYQTAQDLADDLRCFLEHRPIRARRPSPLERVAKWTRRHKKVAAVVFGGLVLAVLGLTVAVALVAGEQAKTQAAYELLAAEQARTQAAYEAEATQRARAEESFRQARDAVDFFTEVSDEDLRDKPALQALRKKMLEGSLFYYQSFLEQRRDDPTLRTELTAGQFRVANILQEIGNKAEAQAALAQARLMEEGLRGDRPPFGRGGRPGPRGMEGGVPFLLTQKSVQEDLKLSEEQVTTIAQLSAKRRDAYYNFPGRGPDVEKKTLEDLAAQEKALVDSLKTNQVRRLGQIALQQRGAFALAEPDVGDALQLTHDQREQVRSIAEELRRGSWGPPPMGPFHPDLPMKSDPWREMSEKLLAVLTVEQAGRWKQMVGEPFQGDLWPAWYGGPGGPGGFGGPMGGFGSGRESPRRPRP